MKAARLLPWCLGVAACVPIGETRRNEGTGKSIAAVPDTIRPPKARSEDGAKILVNQVGYFGNLAKLATLRSDAKQPLDWKLLDADGREIAFGKSQPAGLDVPSGDEV